MASKSVGARRVEECHPNVYHYTTGTGLKGIIESQQLRATHIQYMNDGEEHTGFFEERLLKILVPAVVKGIERRARDPKFKKHIDENGGAFRMAQEPSEKIRQSMLRTILGFNEPYITAFCGASGQRDPDDGLLSQWRGYGTDGGYAVVFQSADINNLLESESRAFAYQFLHWGDVDYYGDSVVHPERREYEDKIQNVVVSYIESDRDDFPEDIYNEVSALACRHKNRGFREECEVRIMAIPSNDFVFRESVKRGDFRMRKTIEFANKNGLLVPHVMLFNNGTWTSEERLPISKIIVGPHPDSWRRRKSIERLLAKHKIEAPVVASSIRYLGN